MSIPSKQQISIQWGNEIVRTCCLCRKKINPPCQYHPNSKQSNENVKWVRTSCLWRKKIKPPCQYHPNSKYRSSGNVKWYVHAVCKEKNQSSMSIPSKQRISIQWECEMGTYFLFVKKKDQTSMSIPSKQQASIKWECKKVRTCCLWRKKIKPPCQYHPNSKHQSSENVKWVRTCCL